MARVDVGIAVEPFGWYFRSMYANYETTLSSLYASSSSIDEDFWSGFMGDIPRLSRKNAWEDSSFRKRGAFSIDNEREAFWRSLAHQGLVFG